MVSFIFQLHMVNGKLCKFQKFQLHYSGINRKQQQGTYKKMIYQLQLKPKTQVK